MRLLAISMAALILLCVVVVTAQDMPTPPPPLGKDVTWMAGEWEGISKSPWGESKERMTTEVGLNGQFLLMNYKSVTEGQPEYTGMGCLTVKGGKLTGYWIDTYRTMSYGEGKIAGNITKMVWEDENGKMTRITEKISNDKFKVSVKMPGPDGAIVESTSEMTRVK